jgi:histidinol phosphatase-like enzyme
MENKLKFKDVYSEHAYFTKKVNEAIKNKQILKESEYKYPNMDKDIQECADMIKSNLNKYQLTFDPKNSFKIYNNPTDVQFNGKANVKGIEFFWTYNLKDDAVILVFPKNPDSTPLYNEIIEFLSDIKQFYIKFKEFWIEKLNNISQQ